MDGGGKRYFVFGGKWLRLKKKNGSLRFTKGIRTKKKKKKTYIFLYKMIVYYFENLNT
jgi:hypothetical protein